MIISAVEVNNALRHYTWLHRWLGDFDSKSRQLYPLNGRFDLLMGLVLRYSMISYSSRRYEACMLRIGTNECSVIRANNMPVRLATEERSHILPIVAGIS